jgi:hypothetical protein
MAAQTGPSNSAWKRYTPFIAVVAVVAIVVGILIATSGNNKSKSKDTTASKVASTKAPMVSYSEAKAAGTTANYTWGSNCDTSSGLVKLPSYDAPPCVPKFTGNNGGAIDPAHGITKDTIRVAYYSAPPDPQGDALLKSVGAYDSPSQLATTNAGYVAAISKAVETYGRKIQLVKLQGTGTSTNEQAAHADAVTAKQLKVFAVLGGPAQTISFSQTLADEGILCIGSCEAAQPEAFYKQNSPYIWPGIEPDQTSALNVEFVKKQLLNQDAIYAGDPKFKTEKRTFAILSYDTSDGQYKAVWQNWIKQLRAAGVPVKGQVDYFLNIPTVQADAQTIVQKLKALDATTVIFTGDPLAPIYFTKEATKQNYFPEWVLSGTVYADTAVFARQFDQRQWAHAFGMSLIPTRIPKTEGAPYAVYTNCGVTSGPPATNAFGIVYANVDLLMTGITLAGPHLSAQNFYSGFTNYPVLQRDPQHLREVTSYGDHGIWPNGTDYGGADTTALVWWDPKAPGEDETGSVGKGEYRYMDNGARFLPGDIPTTAMGLFKTANTVTYFDSSGKYQGTQAVPAALKPLPCQS